MLWSERDALDGRSHQPQQPLRESGALSRATHSHHLPPDPAAINLTFFKNELSLENEKEKERFHHIVLLFGLIMGITMLLFSTKLSFNCIMLEAQFG